MTAIETCIEYAELMEIEKTAAAARVELAELKRKAEAWDKASTLWTEAEKSKYHETFVEWFHARFAELYGERTPHDRAFLEQPQ